MNKINWEDFLQRIKTGERLGRQPRFLFSPATQPPYTHPNDDSSPPYKVRNLQSEWDRDGMILVCKSLSCHPDKPFRWHSNNILSRHSK